MADDLGAPLRKRGKREGDASTLGRLRRGFPIARSIAAVLVVIALGITARLYLTDEPEGGRPSAEVAISTTRDTNPVASEVTIETLNPDPVPVASPAGGPAIITLGDDFVPTDGGSFTTLAGADGLIPDLLETTDSGAIPRTSAGGQTPFKAYSKALITPENAAGQPLIAIVVTGMGLNEAGTLDAVSRLPPAITLAFAPYGKTLDVTIPAARAEGHELLLQVPLEPFDYPDNDPGPQTLLTGQTPRANLDNLFWLMARFGGYVGVMNHMGARFTASGGDFAPIMEELGTRGLGYVDDGSSNRSVSAELAEANKVPFVRSDIMLDLVAEPASILDELAALEARAKANGHAVGVISALPVSITTLASWSEKLADRGFLLVPVSALMQQAAP